MVQARCRALWSHLAGRWYVHVSVLGAAFIIVLLLLGCHDNSVSIDAVWLRYMASCFVSSDQGRGEGAFNVRAPKGVKPVVQTRLLVEL